MRTLRNRLVTVLVTVLLLVLLAAPAAADGGTNQHTGYTPLTSGESVDPDDGGFPGP